MRINLIAPINRLGYGVAGLNILKALDETGHEVTLWPVYDKVEATHHYRELLEKTIARKAKFDAYAPSVRIWHQNDMALHVGHGKKVGFPFFELDRLTDVEKHHLSTLDKVLVTSNWAKHIVDDAIVYPELDKIVAHERDTSYRELELIRKVNVVPLGVDSTIFSPKQSTRKTTVFLNSGKWEVRKGHDLLASAFNEAFDENDDVELWMLCENPFYPKEKNEEWSKYYKSSRLGNKIRILPPQATHWDVAKIMQQADCGVFPSRGEGWNLELLEMMACGKQVIATDYSAHTAYCNKDNCELIPVDGTEPAFDGVWFHNQGEWAALDDSQFNYLVAHLQNIHQAKQAGTLGFNEAGIETAKKFSWVNTANKLVEAING